ncbi:MAG: AraC family transcriptional regulator [Gammaproteobacteria bacterium]|nr:AraC family transcriptional regulator [Gammaproteobacteria bacterium]MBU1602142.1 AraC family transcriptional regulator [Gammaproteobacteria bacterium]MBU2434189.1 AraC family transcriptional regulator [Gammaproteobacteria bacterium]MBU2448487.1 AraC family transcriptional regulator [Gammaproteobacteria bacterium]
MRDTLERRYAERFNKVLDYIEMHLDEALTAEQLSQIANFSKFHFHRQFAEYIGTSVGRYILLLRLRRASYQLAFDRSKKIIDIALEAGFENPESFTRAFKNTFGRSPSTFRRQPDWESWHERYRFRTPERTSNVQVDIVEFSTTRIAVMEHRGPTEKVNDSVAQFIAWRIETGLSPKQNSRTFGIAYDNPDTTEPTQFRFDIGGEVMADVPANQQGVVTKSIPGGRCARVRHCGSHNRLGESIYPLYRNWLPESGEELRDYPLYFHYLNLIPETPENELVTDIYLPLK